MEKRGNILSMHLIKDNFYTIVKLWLNQFAMMFFGILVLLPTAKNDNWLMPAASAFSVLFYFVLIFWCCCEVGLNDSVKLEGGRMKKQWYKCTVLALVAQAPSFIASIVACIAKAFIPNIGYFASAEDAIGTAANVYSIATVVNEVLNIMYRGLFVFFDLDRFPFIYFLTALLAVGVCTAGYNGGTKGLFANLLSRKKNK